MAETETKKPAFLFMTKCLTCTPRKSKKLMQTDEVWKIFAEKKEEYLREVFSDEHPTGILLGGQGAVGKGRLNLWAERLYPENAVMNIDDEKIKALMQKAFAALFARYRG